MESASEVVQGVHTLVQDARHVNGVLIDAIKQYVRSDQVTAITGPERRHKQAPVSVEYTAVRARLQSLRHTDQLGPLPNAPPSSPISRRYRSAHAD